VSTPVNHFRSRRHFRQVHREGRYFLASEATELELEVLDRLRQTIKKTFGKDAAIEEAFRVEVDQSNPKQLLVRTGMAYIDGYPIEIQAGTDHLVDTGQVPSGLSMVRVATADSTESHFALNFTGVASEDYSLVVSIQEELITAQTDPNLRSANLNEDTAEKHRITVNFNVILQSELDYSPVPYKGSIDRNYVNEVEITRLGVKYSLLDSSPVTGSEQIDGRNIQLIFDNSDGGIDRAFPITNDNIEEYVQGKLIDTNGVEFHITSMYVTPGNANQVTMILDLEKTRPVTAGTNQPEPVIADGGIYKLVKRDLYVTSASNLPTGVRYWKVADFSWNGLVFSNVVDTRAEVLALNAVVKLLVDRGLTLGSEGYVYWDKDESSGKLSWSQPLEIHSIFTNWLWTINAGDTDTLFGEALAENQVLYVNLDEKPLGGNLTLKKGTRGTGELAHDFIKTHKLYWIAKRHTDDRVYFNGGLILNDKQLKYFYDIPVQRLLPQDLLSLGYKACFDEIFDTPTLINPSNSTGLYFAEAYELQYSNRVLTVNVDNVTIPSAPSFTVQVGDVIVYDGKYTHINNVNSQTDFDVDDGSILATGESAIISQVLETFNIREAELDTEQNIASYYSTTINNALVTYDDSVTPISGNDVKAGFSITSDNTLWTDVEKREEDINAIEPVTNLLSNGTDVRLRFMATHETGDGTAILDSFRVFMHDRTFVGTILPSSAIAGTSVGGGSGVSGGTYLEGPSGTNNSGDNLIFGKALQVTSSGYEYAQPTSKLTAKATVGVLISAVTSGNPVAGEDLVTSGLAAGVLTGLGFTERDEIYLGIDGALYTAAQAEAMPAGYVAKELGFAINEDDMWVRIATSEQEIS
jgi:hypothetical protein